MDIKCTVVMLLYNGEKYLEQALNSFLAQETEYKVQLIIADDCSTDNSVAIAEKYEQAHEGKIKVLYSKRNLGMTANEIRVFEELKSEYFCMLDADDYWIDNSFLQKAIDFLEKNREFTCYGSNTIVVKGGEKTPYIKREELSIVTDSIEDYLEGRAVCTHTTASVYRNVIFKNGVPWIMKNTVGTISEESFAGDQSRFVMHLKYGKAMFVNDFVGIYRKHAGGIYSGASVIHNLLLELQTQLDYIEFYDGCYELGFRKRAQIYYPEILKRKREGELLGNVLSEWDKAMFENAKRAMIELQRTLDVERQVEQTRRVQREVLWANVFHDVVRASEWMDNNVVLTPGRNTMGYPGLYALYRVLDEIRPDSVLELRLGQATKMVAAYIEYMRSRGVACTHCVIEHDENWINHYRERHPMQETELIRLNITEERFDTAGANVGVYLYDGFQKALCDKKFDFIVLDRHLETDVYAELNLLSLLPMCLKERFAILMDDCDSMGEYVRLIEDTLKEYGIDYSKVEYEGEKASLVLAAKEFERYIR